MKYRKMARTTCERYCTQNHPKTSVIISIKTSWDKECPKIYCDAGVSRSAGVLCAILKYYEGVDKTNKVHNELAYNMTIKALEQFVTGKEFTSSYEIANNGNKRLDF